MPDKIFDKRLGTGIHATPVQRAFAEHYGKLRKYISRFVRSTHDIDDIAQESFLRAFRVERQRAIEHPRSFLFQIAHNVALKELTKKSNQIVDYLAEIDESEIPWGLPTTEEEIIAHQSIGIHCEAVARLPVKCRRVYLMRKVHGMSHKEIADRLGIAVSSVEKHMAKGLRDCKQFVEKAEKAMKEGELSPHTTLATSRVKSFARDTRGRGVTPGSGGRGNG